MSSEYCFNFTKYREPKILRRDFLKISARIAVMVLTGSALSSCGRPLDFASGTPVGADKPEVLSAYMHPKVVTAVPPGSTPQPEAAPTALALEVYPSVNTLDEFLQTTGDVTEFENQENGAIRHFQRAYGGGLIHFSVIDLSNPSIHFDIATPNMARPGTVGTSATFVDNAGNPIDVAPMPPNALVDNYQQIHPNRRVAVAITGDFGYGSPEGTAVLYPHEVAKVNFGRSALCRLPDSSATIENIGNHNVGQCVSAIGGGPKSRRLENGDILFNPDNENFAQVGERISRMKSPSRTTFASLLSTQAGAFLIASVGIGLTGYDHLLGLPPFNTSLMLDDASQTYYETRIRDPNGMDRNVSQPVINDPLTSALVVFVQS